MGSRVFIGGLTYRVRERDVECFFRKYGRVKDVAMKSGFAFVEFHDYRDAEDAILGLNGKELLGERVSVEKARGTPHGSDRWLVSGGDGGNSNRDRDRSRDKYSTVNRTNYRLIVENLSSRISWRDLKNYMRLAGEVTYANAHNRRSNEGVVEFASYSNMRSAIEMFDNTELNGRQIHLVECFVRGGRDGGRGSSRSRSDSPKSRSRSRSKQRSRSRSHTHSPEVQAK